MTRPETSTESLVEFLRARLDDRQARAAKLLRYAQENDLTLRDPRLLGRVIPGWHEWPEVEQMAREALAEVDAKRRIIALHFVRDGTGGDWDTDPPAMCNECNHELHPCQTLRLLALPYADRPGYRQEWRP